MDSGIRTVGDGGAQQLIELIIIRLLRANFTSDKFRIYALIHCWLEYLRNSGVDTKLGKTFLAVKGSSVRRQGGSTVSIFVVLMG